MASFSPCGLRSAHISVEARRRGANPSPRSWRGWPREARSVEVRDVAARQKEEERAYRRPMRVVSVTSESSSKTFCCRPHLTRHFFEMPPSPASWRGKALRRRVNFGDVCRGQPGKMHPPPGAAAPCVLLSDLRCCLVRQDTSIPGAIRSRRELSLSLPVGLDITAPTYTCRHPGIEQSNGRGGPLLLSPVLHALH